MDTALLDVLDAKARGYRPLVDFATWRVAVLGFDDDLRPDQIHTMERHSETDEVFFLAAGQAVLILGGNQAEPDGVHPVAMDSGKVYNIRRGTWHGIVLTEDASVLLVENLDTGSRNTEVANLTPDCRQKIRDVADRGLGG
jgi:uncharacterized protein YjlB